MSGLIEGWATVWGLVVIALLAAVALAVLGGLISVIATLVMAVTEPKHDSSADSDGGWSGSDTYYHKSCDGRTWSSSSPCHGGCCHHNEKES